MIKNITINYISPVEIFNELPNFNSYVRTDDSDEFCEKFNLGIEYISQHTDCNFPILEKEEEGYKEYYKPYLSIPAKFLRLFMLNFYTYINLQAQGLIQYVPEYEKEVIRIVEEINSSSIIDWELYRENPLPIY